MKVAFVFPGQGSQSVGMLDAFADDAAVQAVLDAAGGALGEDLRRLVAEGPAEQLNLTVNTQPVMLAASVAIYRAWLAAGGEPPAVMAGHSLGEYSAYVAAGSLTPTDGARVVRRRGALMLEAGQVRAGAMAAVIGLGAAEVAAHCAAAASEGEVVVPANLNAPDQTVISGDPAAVARAGDACRAAGAKRVLPLKVSGAFHSPLMAPAVPGLRAALEAAAFAAPRFPVVANATALPVRDITRARALLAEQVVSPVRWVECMQTCRVDHPRARFLEVGPGSVLSGLLKRIVPGTRGVTLGTADEVEKFLAA